MLFGSKRRKIAQAVLKQVQPEFAALERLIGPLPPGVASDQYVLGYLVASIGIITQTVSGGKIGAEDKGFVLFHCIKAIFGGNAPSNEQITNLIESGGAKPDFVRGAKAAEKIMCTIAGFPDYENDPEVVAAREEIRTVGKSLDFLTPGAAENTKVAGHLQAKLFNQYVVQRYGKR